jgi:septin 7
MPESREVEPNSRAAAPIVPVNDNRNIVRRKLTGYVGFANLPNQWHRKSVRKGFNFNVMVVGELPVLPLFLVYPLTPCL